LVAAVLTSCLAATAPSLVALPLVKKPATELADAFHGELRAHHLRTAEQLTACCDVKWWGSETLNVTPH